MARHPQDRQPSAALIAPDTVPTTRTEAAVGAASGPVEFDWADRHVERWRNHWVDIDFDEEVEAIAVRLSRIHQHFRHSTQVAAREVGLQDFEYQTLHQLMIRDTPGLATPSALADDLGLSGAGMTGRLDAMERAGWLRRHPDPADRRRIQVEATPAGLDIWRQAMALRGHTEDDLVGTLSASERTTLAGLLRRLTLHIEHDRNTPAGTPAET